MDSVVALLAIFSLFAASSGLVYLAATLWQKIRDQRLDAMIDEVEAPQLKQLEDPLASECTSVHKVWTAEDQKCLDNLLSELADAGLDGLDLEAEEAAQKAIDDAEDEAFYQKVLKDMENASADFKANTAVKIRDFKPGFVVAKKPASKKKPAKKKPPMKKVVPASKKKPAKRR